MIEPIPTLLSVYHTAKGLTCLYYALNSVFLINFLAFFVAQERKDNSIVDILWGLLFIVPNAIVLFITKNWNPRTIITFAMVCLWGLRLISHIYRRHDGEDRRYAAMRKKWNKHGKVYFYLASFFGIFMLQAVCSLFINASALYISVWSKPGLTWNDYIGTLIWSLGYIIETVSDRQLDAFKQSHAFGSGCVLKTGLWRYSRHPNYFGESLMWWGIATVASSIKFGWMTMFSAALITFLLRFVSGVPTIEKHQKKSEEFKQYMKETNAFIPWLPKKL